MLFLLRSHINFDLFLYDALEVIYVPKNAATIFSTSKIKARSKKLQPTDNKRDGPYITKKGINRYITPSNYLPDIRIPGISDEINTYLERMKKTEKLTRLAQMSNDILFRCRTVFPFDFFPDTVIVDKTKVNFIIKEFFLSEIVHSIMIKNIKDIQVETSAFFAKIVIIPDVYLGQAITVSYLSKSGAQEARRVIQGLMLCYKEGIDISDLDASEIKNKIEIAGTAIEVKHAS